MTNVAQTTTLVHGYTLADVERIARTAARKHHAQRLLDDEDRYETAWHAVVVELYETPVWPAFIQLLSAGLSALDDAARHAARHGGLSREGPSFDDRPGRALDSRMFDGRAPNFTKYWLPVRRSFNEDFTDHLIEGLALPNAMSVLTREQHEAIVALAAYDNRASEAAEALGLKYHGFMYRVYSARAKIRAVWFEDETPVQSKPTGVSCRSGHSRAEHGKQLADGRWQCMVCKRAADLRSRVRNKARPVPAASDAA